MIGEALALNTTLTVPPPRLTQAPALLLRPSYPLDATTSPPPSEGCGSAYISVPNHPLPPNLSRSPTTLPLHPCQTPPLSPSQVCLPSPLPPLQSSLCNPSPLPSPPCPLCARTLFLPHASRQHRSASPPPTACFAAKPCLHAAVLASPLDIRERLRPEQHSPCSRTRGACDGRRPSRRRSCRSAYGDCPLADGAAAADGASASYVTVLADRGAAADLARASNAAVLTDGGAAAALARASSALVLADARAPAFSAQVLFTVVRALLADRGHSPLGSSPCVTKVSAGDHSPCLCLRPSHQLLPTQSQLV